MGTNTKGFVLTSNKDVMLISGLVCKAINQLIIDEKHLMFPSRSEQFSKKAHDAFQTCTLALIPEADMVSVRFVFRSECRSMTLFFTCDSDHATFGGKSVSVSLGCSGLSEIFIKVALHAMSLLGPVYFIANDSGNDEYSGLDEQSVTVLGALRLKYISASKIAGLVEAWDDGQFGEGRTFLQWFGAPGTVVRELVARTDYHSAWDELDGLSDTVNAMPRFMEEFHQTSMEAA